MNTKTSELMVDLLKHSTESDRRVGPNQTDGGYDELRPTEGRPTEGMIESDYQVTTKMAQRILDAVEEREGPEFPGWSRINPGVTRMKTWRTLKDSAHRAESAGEKLVDPGTAYDIRREFGVLGLVTALESPKKKEAK